MALFNFIKSPFIEVIEWTDGPSQMIVHKYPVRNSSIKMGAQLTVRESQTAVFVNEGAIADMFTPGHYTLSTQNMPLLTALKSWKYGFNSPFKADIFFVSTRQLTDQRWGTTNPVMMRDPELGPLRLRGFGTFSFRVSDPCVFLKEIFGTSSSFEADDINKYLKSMLVSSLSDYLAEMRVPAFDIAMHYDEIGDGVRKKLNPRFDAIGLKLTAVLVENISLPESVEKVLDQRTSMGVIGAAMPQYAQYQSVEAMRDAAKNPGGAAGAGVGFGAGAALGNMMGGAMNGAMGGQQAGAHAGAQQAGAQPGAQAGVRQGGQPGAQGGAAAAPQFCQSCGGALKPDAKFCPQCGYKL
ncbi:MAG: SPFH domain-containing protein [Clostridiales bacterium]|jgi:membrane protease subunit (stomatin/prohibitin family)|nr:SPFH domain-containing protein [Clostridiales bacterium]